MSLRIKELAEQSGIHGGQHITIESLERFSDLIRYDETKACAKHYLEIMRDAVEQAVLKEREACAKLCEDLRPYDCVSAIRQRGEK